MEEVIENEPWKIDDEDLWDAFAGCKPSPYILDQNRQPVLVKQNEIEVIKYNVVSVPDPYTGYPGYLRLMWIRERKFGKFPLRKKDAPAFFKRVFALGGTEVGVQGIQYRLNGLEYGGYFKSGGSSYILTRAEEKKAKEWFDNLVRKAEHSKEVTVPSSPVSDSVPDDSPLLCMAATGKGNRQTYPLEIAGKTATIDPANDPADTRVTEYSEKALDQRASEKEPIIAAINEVRDAIKENTTTSKKGRQSTKPQDRKTMAEAVCEGVLKAEVLKNMPKEMKKERDALLHDQFGMTATDIARLDGATGNSVRKTSQNIQKSLDRKK